MRQGNDPAHLKSRGNFWKHGLKRRGILKRGGRAVAREKRRIGPRGPGKKLRGGQTGYWASTNTKKAKKKKRARGHVSVIDCELRGNVTSRSNFVGKDEGRCWEGEISPPTSISQKAVSGCWWSGRIGGNQTTKKKKTSRREKKKRTCGSPETVCWESDERGE